MAGGSPPIARRAIPPAETRRRNALLKDVDAFLADLRAVRVLDPACGSGNFLYNASPTWLQNAHAALDRAVWDAYGWPADEIPATVEEDVILSRMLALNGERSKATA